MIVLPVGFLCGVSCFSSKLHHDLDLKIHLGICPQFLKHKEHSQVITLSGQIIATSHDLGPQKVAEEGKSPYFRKIQVGEIL